MLNVFQKQKITAVVRTRFQSWFDENTRLNGNETNQRLKITNQNVKLCIRKKFGVTYLFFLEQ